MFTKGLLITEFIGRKTVSDEIEISTWKDVVKALNRLDGVSKIDVFLSKNPFVGNDSHLPQMCISGGVEGVYFCSFENDEDLYRLVQPNLPDESIDLLLGGQEVFFDKRECVGLDHLIKAVKTFTEKGERDQSLVWVKESDLEVYLESLFSQN